MNVLDPNTLQAGNSSTNSGAQSNPENGGARIEEQHVAPPNLVVVEEKQCMPITNMTRIMRRALPPHAKISEEAKDAIQECVFEFISFITSEANDRCQHEHRKIVTAEDVLWAMERLGFDDYLGPLTIFLQRYRQNAVDCLARRKGHVPLQ